MLDQSQSLCLTTADSPDEGDGEKGQGSDLNPDESEESQGKSSYCFLPLISDKKK